MLHHGMWNNNDDSFEEFARGIIEEVKNDPTLPDEAVEIVKQQLDNTRFLVQVELEEVLDIFKEALEHNDVSLEGERDVRLATAVITFYMNGFSALMGKLAEAAFEPMEETGHMDPMHLGNTFNKVASNLVLLGELQNNLSRIVTE